TYRAVQRQAPRYAVVTGKAYRPRIALLGRARWPAIAFVAAFFLVSQALPLLMLGWASALPFLRPPSAEAFAAVALRHFRSIPPDLLVRIVRNTAILMVAVPPLTMIASLAISWVVLRARARGAAVIDFLAFLPVTVPPIVFSVAALLLALFVLGAVVPL